MSNTLAITDVLDFTVERYSATGRGDMLSYVNYAKSSTISTTAERLEIRGGRGNFKILDVDHSKAVAFNANLALVDIKLLAEKMGKAMTTGTTTTPNTEILSAGASNTITLSKTPLAGTLKLYLLAGERDFGAEQTVGTPATTPNEYSLATATVTLNATTAPEGTKFIASYDYTSGVTADTLKVTASDFPGFIRIRGRGFAPDDVTGLLVPVTFDVKKAKVKPDFELTMAAGEATEMPFECDCYPVIDSDNDTTFIKVVKLNDEAA
jgi:hypothetical protein